MSMSQTITQASDVVELRILPSEASKDSPGLSRTISKDTAPNVIETTATELPSAAHEPRVSTATTVTVIFSVASVNFLISFISGCLVTGLPTIAKDIKLSEALLFWPISIQSLVNACTLLVGGSVCDAVGSRIMYLIGSLLQTVFTIACGLSRTGTQLIVFRGICGLAASFTLPAAVSLITSNFPEGRRRNAGFSIMGGGLPIGFALGLTLGGVFAEKIGWQWGFYFTAILNALFLVIAALFLPNSSHRDVSAIWQAVKHDIDWVGALIASMSLAMLSYVLAAITSSTRSIRTVRCLVPLCLSAALVPCFVYWMDFQVRKGRPALIPNRIWSTQSFTVISLSVLITWGTFNGGENLITFYLQYVQGVSPLKTSYRYLPEPVSGTVAQLAVGLLVHKVASNWLILVAGILNLLSPLLMALNSPQYSYWTMEFTAIAVAPVGADVLYIISNLLISKAFPENTQGLAGGVFNTLSQIGKSIGIALVAAISNTVTQADESGARSPEALLKGYRAGFWFCFALNAAVLIISSFGLRRIGKVGLKTD